MLKNEAPIEGADVVTLPTAPAVESFLHDDLRRSGLLASEIGATPFVDPFTKQTVGYRIPYYLPDGTPHPQMYRVRLAAPPPGGGKYSQPDKSAFPDGTYPYLPPQNAMPTLRGPAIIVEGEKKTLTAIKFLQRVAYGIGGCWNWSRTDADGLHRAHPDLLGRFQPGSVVEIVFDGDLRTNEQVQTAAGTLRRRLIEAGMTPMFVLLPTAAKGKAGLDDWLVAQHASGVSVSDAFDKLPRTSGVEFIESRIDAWDALALVLNKAGTPFNNESNIVDVLLKHDWFAGRLRYNETLTRMEFTDPTGRYYENDQIAPQIVRWLQTRLGMPGVTTDKVFGALSLLTGPGSPIAYNAVADRLTECKRKWDGQPRLDTLLVRALHLPDTAYHRAASRAFFLGAARRATQPGCKMDYVLVLAGKGGIGKTTLFKHIAMNHDWVAEVTDGLDKSKDARLTLTRGWIIEASEGVALDLASAGGAKAIITDQNDLLRPPYGKSAQRYPRRTVLVASTNDETLLKYEAGSGNRRFLPITMRGAVNLTLLDAEIEHVWGEALTRVQAGEREWEAVDATSKPLEELAASEVAMHTEVDPWAEELAVFLSDPTHLHVRTVRGVKGLAVASRDLLLGPLRLLPDGMKPYHGKRLRRAMAEVDGGVWQKVDVMYRDPTSGAHKSFTGYWRSD